MKTITILLIQTKVRPIKSEQLCIYNLHLELRKEILQVVLFHNLITEASFEMSRMVEEKLVAILEENQSTLILILINGVYQIDQ